MIQNPEVINTIVSKFPQLKNYMENPDTSEWFSSQIKAGLKGLVGGSQSQFIADPNFEKPSTRGTKLGKTPEGLPINIFQDVEVKNTTDKIKSDMAFLRTGIKGDKFNSYSIPIPNKLFDPFMEGVVFDFMNEMQYLGEAGVSLGMNILNMDEKEKEHSKYWENGPVS